MLKVQLFKTQESGDSLIIGLCDKIGARGKFDNFQSRLLQADIYWHASVFLSLAGFLAMLGFIMGELWDTFLVGAILGLVMGAVPFAVMRIKVVQKSRLVERQMPEVMELLARSLRAGHTLPSAIELASREVPHPLGTELLLGYEEQRLGISMAQALRHMMDRIASQDFRYFVTAVLIQSETGGNLAEIMEKIGKLIRERLRVKGKIASLTAEGRLSALILGLLPFFMFAILFALQRDYVMTLFRDPFGRNMLMGSLVSIGLGVICLKRMIAIKV